MTQTLQGALQAAIRSALGCANDFNGDLHAMCDVYGIPDAPISGRLIPAANRFDASITDASSALNYFLQNPQNACGTLALDFTRTSTLDPRITFSRGSQATLFDSTGALVYAPNNMIRNNTMVGVVAGTPGTLPTNWTGNATVDGLSREIVGAGVENGINYVDVRFSGTSGTGGNSTLLTFESQTQVVASNGQTWAASAYVKLVAGSLANVALFALGIRYNNSGGTSLTAQNTTLTPTATFTRYTSAFAATDATTAFVNSSLVANFTDNSAVDFTLRIGLPQLEQGAFATSVIPTTTTALTRNADVASMTGTNFSSWYNQTEGTFVCNFVDPQSGISGAFFPGIFSASDNSTSNRITCYRDAAVDYKTVVTTSGVLQSNLTNAAVSTSQRRIASAYKLNDFAVCGQGGSVATDTSGTVPTVDRFYVGSNQTGGSQLCGYIQRISYYPVRLPNSTLQALTA